MYIAAANLKVFVSEIHYSGIFDEIMSRNNEKAFIYEYVTLH